MSQPSPAAAATAPQGSVVPATPEAARPEIHVPEAQQPAATAAAANDATRAEAPAETAVMPPETPKVPVVLQNADAIAPTAPADALAATAQNIEKNLAQYLGERLPSAVAEGLTIDVLLASSNAITGRVGQNEYDLKIVVKGGAFTPERAQVISQVLKAHPAFATTKVKFSAEANQLVGKTLALSAAQMTELLKAQPVQMASPVASPDAAHQCSGADCKHHAVADAHPESPVSVTEPKIEPPTPAAPPVVKADEAPAIATAPLADQPLHAEVPATMAAPATSVGVPEVQLVGKVAANDQNKERAA